MHNNKKHSSIIFTLFCLFALPQMAFAEADNRYNLLNDASGGIAQGYGSWGSYAVTREAPVDTGVGTLTFYHPTLNHPQKRATIFFISGWGRDAQSYEQFFQFMASKGNSVVHLLNTNPGSIRTSYPNAFSMIETAQQQYSDWINTRKVALMGHSFGGGATIWVGKKLFGSNRQAGEKNWGQDGRFIFASDPWYTFLMSKEDLQNYPENTKLVIQSNTKNPKIDPRAIRAVFKLINIPNAEKDFVEVNSTNNSYMYNGTTFYYDADHYLIYTWAKDQWDGGLDRPYDALDVYAINRSVDALMDYVFNKNPAAKDTALGNGSAAQINMGPLADLSVSDNPVFNIPSSEYEYKCDDLEHGWSSNPLIWKLAAYCSAGSVNDSPVMVLPLLELLLLDDEAAADGTTSMTY